MFNQTAQVIGELISEGNGPNFAAVVGAPIVEEGQGRVPGRALLAPPRGVRRRGRRDRLRGLVATGFAFTENIYYFGRVFAVGGLVGEAAVSPSCSCCAACSLRSPIMVFTAMTGIAMGSRFTTPQDPADLLPFLGYLALSGCIRCGTPSVVSVRVHQLTMA